ncbi:unnamed protein product [Dracunculus medinensis]|uniref:Uncharacterized protein n=1 Tax=Dracunculus medinensis TaxID=318479 RepID=A0A0N4UL04_DRAME|nr:unnamed protein product [Dracunculus medinensis]
MSIGGGILARTNNRLSQTNSTTTATTTTLNCRSGIAAALTETIINETEFPSLGVRSSPSFNTSVPTTSYSSSPISHNQAYNRDIYNAIQRPPYDQSDNDSSFSNTGLADCKRLPNNG